MKMPALTRALASRDRNPVVLSLLLAFLAFMIVFGAKCHPIEEVNSAEWDGYVSKADALLAGTLPHDPFHPLLYPIASAGAGAVLGDTFAGARLVSSLCAVLLVWSSYLLGRACFSRSAGLLAAAATMVNPNVVFVGVHAASDMMFAALSSLAIGVAVRTMDDSRTRAAATVGALFGLAYFTRYTAVAILPSLLVPVVFGGSNRSRAHVTLRVLAFAGAAAAVLVPHFVLTGLAFGHPFVNDSWKNLAFKLHANWNWELLSDTPYGGLTQAILDAPGAFVASAVRELGKFAFLTSVALGGTGLAGGMFASGAVVGAYATLQGLDRRRATLLVYVVGYVVTICAFFYTSPRLMLPILPACCAWCGVALFGAAGVRPFAWRRLRFHRALPLALLFVLVTVASTAREIPSFIAMHPVDEVRALVGLEEKYGSGITVVGTAPYFGRHVHYVYRFLRVPTRAASNPNATYFERLRGEVAGVDFVVIGRLTGRGIPAGLVDASGAPDYLEAVEVTPSVVVYRVR